MKYMHAIALLVKRAEALEAIKPVFQVGTSQDIKDAKIADNLAEARDYRDAADVLTRAMALES